MYKNDVKGKTRQILGLQYDPYYYPGHHYYAPRRSNSTSSCSSYDISLPSPSSSSLPSIPSSPLSSKDEIFEKLRKMAPKFVQSFDPVESIMEAVSDAMEDDDQSGKKPVREELPLDLQSVDITAFKHLIRSQPLIFDGKIF